MLTEYTTSCRAGLNTRPDEPGSRLCLLIDDYDPYYPSDCKPDNPEWDPGGHMPFEYDDGLVQSKLILRAYAHDKSEKDLAALRTDVAKGIAGRAKKKREKAAEDER